MTSRIVPSPSPNSVYWDDLNKAAFAASTLGCSLVIRTSLYPLMLATLKKQTSEILPPPLWNIPLNNNKGIEDGRVLRRIFYEEGFTGCYKGLKSSLMGISFGPIYMLSLEASQQAMQRYIIKQDFTNWKVSLSSALSGLIASASVLLISTPFHVISSRTAIQPMQPSSSSTFPSSLRQIFTSQLKENGVKGLYRGFGMSLLLSGSSSAIVWGIYSPFKLYMLSLLQSYDKNMWFSVPVSGLLSYAVAGVVLSPLHLIKSRMQVTNSITTKDVLKTILRLQGKKGLLAGMNSHLIFTVLSGTLLMCSYEGCKILCAKASS
jgi:solute carrier family 25 protein 44